MYALLNVSGNDITITTFITRPTAAVKYKVNISKDTAKLAIVTLANFKEIHNVAANAGKSTTHYKRILKKVILLLRMSFIE